MQLVNKLRKVLEKGEVALGTAVFTNNPAIVEIAGYSGWIQRVGFRSTGQRVLMEARRVDGAYDSSGNHRGNYPHFAG
jgi:hypothetical protein